MEFEEERIKLCPATRSHGWATHSAAELGPQQNGSKWACKIPESVLGVSLLPWTDLQSLLLLVLPGREGHLWRGFPNNVQSAASSSAPVSKCQ